MDIDFATLYTMATPYVLKVVLAIVIFFVGKFFAKKAVNIAKMIMRKSKVDETLISFAGNVLFGLAMAFVVIASLSQLGINTTSLAAVVAAAGLAIGLALQDSLSNLASGVMIILFRPFKMNDYIEAAGIAGTVEEISIFTTSMKTPDNKAIIVPNGAIISGNIVNYSKKKTRRIDMVFGVGYDDDLKKVKKILTKIVASDDRILKDPEPVIAVHTLNESSVDFVCRPWVKTEDYWHVFWFLQENVKLAFDKEGISIPFPQRDMHIVSDVNLDKGANTNKKETKPKAKSKTKAA